MADVAIEVCPRCGYRDIDPKSRDGWCSVCVVERIAEEYAAKDQAAVQVRWLSWQERSTRVDSELTKLRQQRHRLIAAIRPREPAPPDADPWQIARDGLRELSKVHASGGQREHLEAAKEAIRRLAWGPD